MRSALARRTRAPRLPRLDAADTARSGRRGAFIQSSTDGRRGLMRAFWSDKGIATDVLASSMEAYFDFDTPEGEDPRPMDDDLRPSVCVSDGENGDLLHRCFRFRYERSWDAYYREARCSEATSRPLRVTRSARLRPIYPFCWHFCCFLASVPECRTARRASSS